MDQKLARIRHDELAARRAGADIALAKLSELLFIEAPRRYVDALPVEQTGWLAGLEVPDCVTCLASSTASLRGNGLSTNSEAKPVFPVLRRRRVYTPDRWPPMRYLGRWRIQVASHQLRDSDATLAQIAENVGYGSEAAFSRAFSSQPDVHRPRGGGTTAPERDGFA